MLFQEVGIETLFYKTFYLSVDVILK